MGKLQKRKQHKVYLRQQRLRSQPKASARKETKRTLSYSKIHLLNQFYFAPRAFFYRSAGKLCLVLDLDHTLLHSVMFSELEPSVNAWLEGRAEADAALPQQEKRMLFRISGMQMYTKLRPGVREFLRRTAEKFELWIHTNGTSFFFFFTFTSE